MCFYDCLPQRKEGKYNMHELSPNNFCSSMKSRAIVHYCIICHMTYFPINIITEFDTYSTILFFLLPDRLIQTCFE